MVMNPPATPETQARSLGREDPLNKGTATTPVFLPRESHGQRSLAGYSPWGGNQSDTANQLTLSLCTSKRGRRHHPTVCPVNLPDSSALESTEKAPESDQRLAKPETTWKLSPSP